MNKVFKMGNSAMISVIIPVYNVEPYLRKCLNSVIDQTYRDLEILIVNDGSTDGSGRICDEYKTDERVRVFHTENRGLSAARNLGLDNASGDWIGFVDSDDWIEPDMYEVLFKKAEETGADVVECGEFLEYTNKTIERKRSDSQMCCTEAIRLLIHGSISNAVWNKLWKRSCFEHIRFPENRTFEEYATTYRIYTLVSMMCTVDAIKYHYQFREDSLSRTHTMKNLLDFWIVNKERMDVLWNRVDEDGKRDLLRNCAISISRIWAYFYDSNTEEHMEFKPHLSDIKTFVNNNYPLLGLKDWSLWLKVGTFFPHFDNSVSLRFAWLFNWIRKRIGARVRF